MIGRLILRGGAWFGVMAACLFAGAGSLDWPQAWALMAMFVFGALGFGLWLDRRDPALLASRLSAPVQKDQPWWDKVFIVVFLLLWHLWLIGMALDARRWQLSHMPIWLNLLGGALVAAGFLASVPVYAANSYAAPQVRIQGESGQHVIDSGPYAVVRHPLYAVAILYLTGQPLLLGSWYGLIGTAIMMLGIARRAVGEENVLARELPGYAGYMTRVRWRMVPYVW